MKTKINEGLPAMVPEIPVNIAGQSLKLRFDTNINKTKKGVKLQFVLPEVPKDPRELQNLANKIGAELQTQFGDAGLQIMYDVENPYRNVIGFLIPLTSISSYIMKNVMQQDQQPPAEEPAQEEEPTEEQPPTEEPPADEEKPKQKLPKEPIAEKHIKLIDLLF